MGFIRDYKFRQWLYRVLAAAFILLGGYGVLTDNQTELWTNLAEAALTDGVPAAAFILASANSRPSVRDEDSDPRHAA